MADKCTPVRSSWLTHVGTYGGKLFVAFRNGVCCLYPNTDDSYYQLALTYASKGHYVHQWLYKLLPYRLIKNPCPAILAPGVVTGCCPGAIPLTLHATYTGAVTVPTSVPLVWNPAALRWESAAFTVCGIGSQFLFLDCTGGVWTLTPGLSTCVQFPNANPTTSPCSPFVLTFNGLSGTCCVGTFTVTITI